MNTTQLSEDQICQAVEALESSLTSFLQQIVRTPSLPDREHAVQEIIAEKLGSLDLNVDIVPTVFENLKDHPAFCDDGFSPDTRINVVGRWSGSGDPACGSLILNGHVDVVPTGDEALWTDSPWSGTIRDGKLYGRGSCDMKAGVTAGIFAIESLKQLGFEPAGDILFESVTGEESGGSGALTTIVAGYSADAVVVLEPTCLKICPVQAGALTFRLTVPGVAIHACMKKFGVSAIQKFVDVFRAIEDLEGERHRQFSNALYDDPTHIAPISIGTLTAGEWHSTVPEKLVAEGRFGVFPGESPDQARKSLEDLISQCNDRDPFLRENPVRLEWIEGQFESGETPSDHPLIEALANAHQSVFGSRPPLKGVTYGADMRLFTNHGKMPAVLYGPGDVGLAHGANEHVPISEVVQAAKVIACLIYRWTGGHTS